MYSGEWGPDGENGPDAERGPDGERGPESRRVMGADGGGTRLRLGLADGMATILARREGPPALALPGQGDALAATLAAEVRALSRNAGVELPLDALVLGLAGVGRPGVAARLRQKLEFRGVALRIRVTTDAQVALDDAFPSDPGILLAAGTGSIALARTPRGKILRAGGWGPLLGDEGSGYSLALKALRSVVRGMEGRGPTTALTSHLLEAVGAASPEGLLSWIQAAEKGEVAVLAPLVVEMAREGDPVAARRVEEAVTALESHVQALQRRLREELAKDGAPPDPEVPVALTGGLIGPGGSLRDLLLPHLEGAGIPLHPEAVDGVRGAIRSAVALL